MVRPRALAVLRLLDGQVAWLGPVENLVHVGSGAPKQISQVRSIGHMTSPSVTGSVAELKTMGRVLVACLAARAVGVPPPIELPFSRSVFNHDVAALDIPEVTQSLEEGPSPVGVSARVEPQEAYSSHLPRRLRFGRERRGDETASDDHHEGAPGHLGQAGRVHLALLTWPCRVCGDGGYAY